MADYQGKKVVIIGLGLTGLSCVDFFMARGVTPRVMDTRMSPPGLDQLPESVERHLGDLQEDWLLAADLIVASPGVALASPALSAAADAGVDIVGDVELFCREAQAPIVAITGSNGKSTVTTLVGEMAKAAGWAVGVGGNIGLPVLELLRQEYQLYVLELSSFQLETTYSLHAAAATILNVTEDHMDRYPFGLQQYRAAKLRIYENAKVCVVNADDALTMPVRGADPRCISFGADVGDYHLNRQLGETWLRVHGEKVLNTREMKLSGRHNYTNALAALALADAVNIPRASSLTALTTYAGLAHRFQRVLDHNGVCWINDSKATNVGSTEAALNGLQVDGTLHLLLGGDGKSADFSPTIFVCTVSVATVLNWRSCARMWQRKPTPWNRRCGRLLPLCSRAIWCCCHRPAPASISSVILKYVAMSLPVWHRSLADETTGAELRFDRQTERLGDGIA